MDLRSHQRNVSYLEKSFTIWAIQYLYRLGEFALNHLEVD